MNARAWVVQFFGVLLLMLVVWALLNTPDERAWHVAVRLCWRSRPSTWADRDAACAAAADARGFHCEV
jgi:hypothetical protein